MPRTNGIPCPTMTPQAVSCFLSVTDGVREPSRRLFEVHDADIVRASLLAFELDEPSFAEAVELWKETDGDKACVARFIIDAHAHASGAVAAADEVAEADPSEDEFLKETRQKLLRLFREMDRRTPSAYSINRAERLLKVIVERDERWH